MLDWLGVLGGFAAVFLAPLAAVYPVILWFVENDLPWLFLALWGVNWIALLLLFGVAEWESITSGSATT